MKDSVKTKQGKQGQTGRGRNRREMEGEMQDRVREGDTPVTHKDSGPTTLSG